MTFLDKIHESKKAFAMHCYFKEDDLHIISWAHKPHSTVLDIVRGYGFRWSWERTQWELEVGLGTNDNRAIHCSADIKWYVERVQSDGRVRALHAFKKMVIHRGLAVTAELGCTQFVDLWGQTHSVSPAVDTGRVVMAKPNKPSLSEIQRLFREGSSKGRETEFEILKAGATRVENALLNEAAKARASTVEAQALLRHEQIRVKQLHTKIEHLQCHIKVLKLEAAPSAAEKAKPIRRRGVEIHCQGDYDEFL